MVYTKKKDIYNYIIIIIILIIKIKNIFENMFL